MAAKKAMATFNLVLGFRRNKWILQDYKMDLIDFPLDLQKVDTSFMESVFFNKKAQIAASQCRVERKDW